MKDSANRTWTIETFEELQEYRSGVAAGSNALAGWTITFDMEKNNILQLTSVEELIAFRDAVNAGNSFAGWTIVLDMVTVDLGGENWIPIGNLDNPFEGTFTGIVHKDCTLGHENCSDPETHSTTITDLEINGTGQDYVGFFGYIQGDGKVQNLNFQNVTINGDGDYVGTVAGYINGEYGSCAIENVKVFDVIQIEGEKAVGGIIGGGNGALSNVTVKADREGAIPSYIKGTSGDVGGIAGRLEDDKNPATTNQYNGLKSDIDVKGEGNGVHSVGGIAGYAGNNVTITGAECDAESVIAEGIGANRKENVGGIVGNHGSNVTLNNAHSAIGTIGGTYTAADGKPVDNTEAHDNVYSGDKDTVITITTTDTIVVDGADPVVKEINTDLTAKALTVAEGHTLKLDNANVTFTEDLTVDGTIEMSAASDSIKGANMILGDSAKIIIDAAGITGGCVHVVDLNMAEPGYFTEAAAAGKIEFVNLEPGLTVFYGKDGDIAISDADYTRVYLTDDAADKAFGTKLMDKVYVGINAVNDAEDAIRFAELSDCASFYLKGTFVGSEWFAGEVDYAIDFMTQDANGTGRLIVDNTAATAFTNNVTVGEGVTLKLTNGTIAFGNAAAATEVAINGSFICAQADLADVKVTVADTALFQAGLVNVNDNNVILGGGTLTADVDIKEKAVLDIAGDAAVTGAITGNGTICIYDGAQFTAQGDVNAYRIYVGYDSSEKAASEGASIIIEKDVVLTDTFNVQNGNSAQINGSIEAAQYYLKSADVTVADGATMTVAGSKGVTLLGNGSALTVYGELAWNESAALTVSKNTTLLLDGGQMTTAADVAVTVETAGVIALVNGSNAVADTFTNNGTFNVSTSNFKIANLVNDGTMGIDGIVTLEAASLTGSGQVNFFGAVLAAGTVFSCDDVNMTYVVNGHNTFASDLSFATSGDSFRIGLAADMAASLRVIDGVKLTLTDTLVVGVDGEADSIHQLLIEGALEMGGALTVTGTGFLKAEDADLTADTIAIAGVTNFTNAAVAASALTVNGTAADKAKLELYGGSTLDIAAVTVDQADVLFGRTALNGALDVTANGTVNFTSPDSVVNGSITNAGTAAVVAAAVLTADAVANNGDMNVDGALKAAAVTNTAALALTADAALTADTFVNSGTVDLNGADFTAATLNNTAEMNVTGEVMFNVAAVEGNGTVNFTDVTLAAGNVYEDAASDMVYNFAGTNTIKADVNFGKTVNQTGLLDITSNAVFEADTINAAGYLSVVVGTVNADKLNVVGDEARVRINGTAEINAADVQIGSDTEKGKLDFVNGTITGAVKVNALGVAAISGDSVVVGSVDNAGIVTIDNKLTVADFANTGVLAVTDGGAFEIETLTNDGTMTAAGTVTLKAELAGSGAVNFTDAVLSADSVLTDTDADAEMAFTFAGTENAIKCALDLAKATFKIGDTEEEAVLTIADNVKVAVDAVTVGADGTGRLHQLLLGAKTALEADTLTVALTGYLAADISSITADEIAVAGDARFVNTAVTADALAVSGTAEDKAFVAISGGSKLDIAAVTVDQGIFEFSRATVTGTLDVTANGTVNVTSDKSVAEDTITNEGSFNILTGKCLTAADVANNGDMNVDGALKAAAVTNTAALALTADAALTADTFVNSGTVDLNGADFTAATLNNTAEMNVTGEVMFNVAAVEGNGTVNFTDVTLAAGNVYEDAASDMVYNFAGTNTIKADVNFGKTVNQTGLLDITSKAVFEADTINAAGYLSVVVGTVNADKLNVVGDEARVRINGTAEINAADVQIGSDTEKGKLDFVNGTITGAVTVNALGVAAISGDSVVVGSVANAGIVTIDNKLTVAEFTNTGVFAVNGGAFEIETLTNDSTMNVTGAVTLKAAEFDGNGAVNFTDAVLSADSVIADTDDNAVMSCTFAGANTIQSAIDFAQSTFQIGTAADAAATLTLTYGADVAADAIVIGIAGAAGADVNTDQLHQLIIATPVVPPESGVIKAVVDANAVTVNGSGYLRAENAEMTVAGDVTVAGYADFIFGSQLTADTLTLDGKALNFLSGSTITTDVTIANGQLNFGNAVLNGALDVDAGNVTVIDAAVVNGVITNAADVTITATGKLTAAAFANTGDFNVKAGAFDIEALENNGTMNISGVVALDAAKLTGSGTVNFTDAVLGKETVFSSKSADMVYTFDGDNVISASLEFATTAANGFQVGIAADSDASLTVNNGATLALGTVFAVGTDSDAAAHELILTDNGSIKMAAGSEFIIGRSGSVETANGSDIYAETVTVAGSADFEGAVSAALITIAGKEGDLAEVTFDNGGKAEITDKIQVGAADGKGKGVLVLDKGSVQGTVQVSTSGEVAVESASSITTVVNDGSFNARAALTADAITNNSLFLTTAALTAGTITNTADFKSDGAVVTAKNFAGVAGQASFINGASIDVDNFTNEAGFHINGGAFAADAFANNGTVDVIGGVTLNVTAVDGTSAGTVNFTNVALGAGNVFEDAASAMTYTFNDANTINTALAFGGAVKVGTEAGKTATLTLGAGADLAVGTMDLGVAGADMAAESFKQLYQLTVQDGAKLTAAGAVTVDQSGYAKFKGGIVEADAITVAGYADVIGGSSVSAATFELNGEKANLRIYGSSTIAADVTITAGSMNFGLAQVDGDLTVAAKGVVDVTGKGTVTGALDNKGAVTVADGQILTAASMSNSGAFTAAGDVTVAGSIFNYPIGTFTAGADSAVTADSFTNRGTVELNSAEFTVANFLNSNVGTYQGVVNVTGEVMFNVAAVDAASNGTVNFTDVTLAAGNVYEDAASAMVYNFAGTNTVSSDLNFGTTVNQAGTLNITSGAVFEADNISVDGFVNVVAGNLTADKVEVAGTDAKLRIHGNAAVNVADLQIGSAAEAGQLLFMNAAVNGNLTVNALGNASISGNSTVDGTVDNKGTVTVDAGKVLAADALNNTGTFTAAGAVTVAGKIFNYPIGTFTAGADAAITADSFTNRGTVELNSAEFTAASFTNSNVGTYKGVMNVTGEVMFNVAAVDAASNGTVNFTDVTLAAGNVYEDAASAMVYNFAGTNTVSSDLNFGTTVNQTGKLEITAGGAFEADNITVDGFVNVVAGNLTADKVEVTGADARLRVHGSAKVDVADLQIGSDTEAGRMDFLNAAVTGDLTVGALGRVTVSSVSSSVTGSVINAGTVAVEEGRKLTADAIDNAGTLTVTAAGLDVDALINNGDLNISGVVDLNLSAVTGSGKINFTDATLGAGTVFTVGAGAALSYIFNGANTISSDLSFAPLALMAFRMTRNTPVFQIGSEADTAASLTIDAAVTVPENVVIGIEGENAGMHQLIVSETGSVTGSNVAVGQTGELILNGGDLTAGAVDVAGYADVNSGADLTADTISVTGSMRVAQESSVTADVTVDGELLLGNGTVDGNVTVTADGAFRIESKNSTVTGTLTNDGDIYIKQNCCLTADALTGNGEIFYVVTDVDGGVKQFINIENAPEDLYERVTIIDGNGDVVEDLHLDFGPNGEVFVSDADATKLFVNNAYSGEFGAKVGDKLYYGLNAFGSMDEAVAEAAADRFVTEITGAAGQDVALHTGVTTENPDGLVINMGQNGLSFGENGAYILLDGGTPVVGAEINALREDAVFGKNVTINADLLWANEPGVTNDIQGTINVNGVYVHLGSIDLSGDLNVSDRMVITGMDNEAVTVREGAQLTVANINSYSGNGTVFAIDGEAEVGNFKLNGTVTVGETGALAITRGGNIGTLDVAGVVSLAPETLQVGTLTGAGSITVDAASFTAGTIKVLDVTGAADFTGDIEFANVAEGMTVLTLADGDKVLTDATFDKFYVNTTFADMAYGEAVEGMEKTYFGINAFADFNAAYAANARALNEGAPQAADAIVLLSDVTADLGNSYSGKIAAGETAVTLTNSGSVMYSTNLTIGEDVTLATAASVWQGTNEIAGSITSTNYVHNWGKTTLTGTAEVYNFFDRYHSTAESGFYVVGTAAAGEGAAAESQLKAKGYLGHYSGTFSVKDSAVEFGYVNLNGTHDGEDYAAATIVLDNAGFKTVGGPNTQPGQLLMEGDVSISAVNGSVINIRGPKDFGYLSMKEGTSITLTDSAMYLGREGQGGNSISGAITLNNSTLDSLGKLNMTVDGSITLDGTSKLIATTITGDGSIILDLTGYTTGTAKVIDLTASSLEGKVTVKGENTSVFYANDGDVWVTDQDKAVIYVGGDYQDQALGEVVNGNVAGFNAFGDINTAVKNADATTGTVQVEQGNSALLTTSVATANPDGLTVDMGNNGVYFDADGVIRDSEGNASTDNTIMSYIDVVQDITIGENVTVNADFIGAMNLGPTLTINGTVNVNSVYNQGSPIIVNGTLNTADTFRMLCADAQIIVSGTLTAEKLIYDDSCANGELTINEGGSVTVTDLVFTGDRAANINNGTLSVTNADITELNIGEAGTLKFAYDGDITIGTLAGNGKITVDTTNYAGGTFKVIDFTGDISGFEGEIGIEAPEGSRVITGADGDIFLTDATRDELFVGDAYADKAYGTVVNSNVVGFNAFDYIVDAVGVAISDSEVGKVTVEAGNSVELNSSFMEDQLGTAAITTENAEGLVIDLGNNNQSWHWDSIDMTTGEAPADDQVSSQISNSFRDFVIGENVTLKADFMAGISYGSYQVKGAVEVNAAFLQGHDLVVDGTMAVKDWLTLSSNVGSEQLTVNGSLTAAKADISEGFAFDVNGEAALDYVEAAGTLATGAEGTLTLKAGSVAAIDNKGTVNVSGAADETVAIDSFVNGGTFNVTSGTADMETVINTGAINVQGGTFAADRVQMEYGAWSAEGFAADDTDRNLRVSFVKKGDDGVGIATTVVLAAGETDISGILYNGVFKKPEFNAYLTAGEYTVTIVDTRFSYAVESSMTIGAGTFEVTGEATVNAKFNNGFVQVTEEGRLTGSKLTGTVTVDGGAVVDSVITGTVTVDGGAFVNSAITGTVTMSEGTVSGTVKASELVLTDKLTLNGIADVATLTVNNAVVIDTIYGASLEFDVLANSGSITFDLADREGETIFRVMDYTGSGSMDPAAYGDVKAEGFNFTVYNNDLYAVSGDFSESVLFVSDDWAGTAAFTDIDGLLYGVNAFSSLDEIAGKSFSKLTINACEGDMGSFDFGADAVDVKIMNTDAAAEFTMQDGSIEISAGSTLDGIINVEHSMFISGEGTFAGTLHAEADPLALTGITLEIVGTTVNAIEGFTSVIVDNAALTDITMSVGSDIFYAESSLAVESFDFCTGLDDLLYLADGVTVEAAEIASAGSLTIFTDVDTYVAGTAIFTVGSNGAFANAGTTINVEIGKAGTLQSQYVLVDGITEFNGFVVFGDQKIALGEALYVNSVEYDLHLTDGKLTLDIFHGKKDLHVHSDLNGDDVADILITDSYGSAGAWLVGENGSLAWKQLYSIGQNSGWNFFDVIDTNNDNRSDVVLYNNNGTIGVWEMQADGSAVYKNITSIGTEIPIIMRDFDGDGAADMLSSNQAGDTIAFRFADGKTLVGRINDWDVKAVTDLDGNGVADVILQNGRNVGAWLMGEDGQPTWWGSPYALSDDRVAKNDIAGAGDFDGNGVGDILISTANADGSTSYGAWMFDNARNIVWRSFTTLSADSTLEGIDDYDGDGAFELRIRTGNEISILDLGVSLDDTTVTVDKKVLGSVSDNHNTTLAGKVL